MDDITKLKVDAIVNTSSCYLDDYTGFQGAIKKAAGTEMETEFKLKFETGIKEGTSGFTKGYNLPAKYIIHTVIPQRNFFNPTSLKNCYESILKTASEIEIKSLALPLLGCGDKGWTMDESLKVALRVFINCDHDIDEIFIVTDKEDEFKAVNAVIRKKRCLLLLEGVRELHRRGYQNVRILPYMAPSGVFWRLDIFDTITNNKLRYSSGGQEQLGNSIVQVDDSSSKVADVIFKELSLTEVQKADQEYAIWLDCLVEASIGIFQLPWAFAEYVETDCWHLGSIQFPLPPNYRRNIEL
ncbi:hypothetical protein IV53_GL000555 [Ligilactobacillus ceti DSM 22408]|uniref:Macro domain-containing protein n=2 Tax=Ligilactobacillus TaxID=2767887 RepID=A0A0R2KGW0_9LACO|nr:hypothetical protein IV53_GL000555 [Ligilactobacillus ceti DSM 22408]